ncbi:hypothetical protein LCGC14_1051490 [marine sediment metagenome]|uniref:Helix-turn-helix domain-containing protein n=1 Tax=marine sediment metagenome TaxID=412755 RepID=A0A0F9MNQ0_9ZZZZ
MGEVSRPAIPHQIMFSLPDIAEILHISKLQARNWINGGEIQGFKVRGKFYVTREELVKWIKSKETGSG